MARKEVKGSFLRNNIFLITGIFLICIFSFWRYHQLRILSFNMQEIAKLDSSTGIKPTYIKSYPLGIDVSIKDTIINKGVWAIQPDTASYLVDSAKIGDKGNIIIYGHNKDNILGPIRWIKVGAKIEITGSDEETYIYEVVKTDTVNSDNLSYILPTSEETLTLYTCVGFLDNQRFIVVAKRIKLENN